MTPSLLHFLSKLTRQPLQSAKPSSPHPLISSSLLACLVLLSSPCFTTSCVEAETPETPNNEIENKLHEDPAKAVFTLTKGSLRGMTPDQLITSIPSADTLEFVPSKNEKPQTYIRQLDTQKGWIVAPESVTKMAVVSAKTEPLTVYKLDIQYYDAKGESMNHQFLENGQDVIHQHFFSYYNSSGIRVRNLNHLPYVYVYADVDPMGNFIGHKNPLGFRGFLQFKKSNFDFTLSVDLMHATQSKYSADGSTSAYHFPSADQLGTALWDITEKLPISIQP